MSTTIRELADRLRRSRSVYRQLRKAGLMESLPSITDKWLALGLLPETRSKEEMARLLPGQCAELIK